MRRSFVLLAVLAVAACGRETPEAPKPTPSVVPTPAPPASEPDDLADELPAAPDPAAEAGEPPREPAGEAEDAQAPRKLADGPYVSLAGSGGRAHWVGQAPAPKQLAFNPDTAAQCQHEGTMDTLDRSLLVDAGGGIAHVVIEIDVADREVVPAPAPLEMDQRGCSFLPHVLLVPAGSEVTFRNSDPFTHNVNVVARRNQAMNAMLGEDGTRTERYEKGDPMQLKCDIHPWMSAWVYVSDAPVHVLSGADGSFVLPALPPGSHKVSCWHESQGKASGTLEVGDDGTIAALDLALGKKR